MSGEELKISKTSSNLDYPRLAGDGSDARSYQTQLPRDTVRAIKDNIGLIKTVSQECLTTFSTEENRQMDETCPLLWKQFFATYNQSMLELQDPNGGRFSENATGHHKSYTSGYMDPITAIERGTRVSIMG